MSDFTLIAGPTASGKSALALALARRNGGMVVNVDSMQVYADLRILSARPSREEERLVPHQLYGFVPSSEEFSVGRYLSALRPLVEATRAGGPPLVLVGGTGLYFRAMTCGLMETPPVPEETRAFWRAQAGAAGVDLHAELRRRDPARADELHPADTPRLLRAIELYEATGRPYTYWRTQHPGEILLPSGKFAGYVLNPPRAALQAAIDRRFMQMMEQGASAEIDHLLAHQPPLARNLGVMKAHGVPHLVGWREGRLSEGEAIARGQSDTRRYARRQIIFAGKYLVGPDWCWCGSVAEAQAALALD